MRHAASLLLLAACANEIDLQPVGTDSGNGAASAAWEDRQARVREEVFAFGGGATTPVVDYLFVVDNSSSMANVVDRVRAGFAALADEGVWPDKARVAVTSTVPGRLDGVRAPHPAARRVPGLIHDPGFLRLVDAGGISRFRTRTTPEVAERFPHDGCEAWFRPGDTNALGVPCLVAHTQTAMTDVGVEAGLVAFEQLLTGSSDGKKSLFRAGAAVNVIFVSDTHDPGKNPELPAVQDLIEARPDFARLDERIRATHPVASLRVHAIAPRSECSEAWADIGPSYFEVARDGGGVTLDVCTATDYSGVIRRVVSEGAVVQRPVFPLGRKAEDVEEVWLAGEPVPFTVSGGVVVLEADAPIQEQEVRVRYQYAVRRPARSLRASSVGNALAPGAPAP